MVLTVVRKTIEEYKMISRGDLVLCGVSGGPDSMCLLDTLSRLSGELEFSLYVGYLHHHMRDQADEDARLVVHFATQLGIPSRVGHADVPRLAREMHIGLEEAGRLARYKFLRSLREKVGAASIALGHNMNDQAETVLMRLLRGVGTEGLAGIPPVGDHVIRPLINLPRPWIEEYCRVRNLQVIQDVYNFDLKYERNIIRHRVMPELARLFNPSLIEALWRTSRILRWDAEFLDEKAEEAFLRHSLREGRITLVEVGFLKGAWRALSSRVLEKAWRECAGSEGSLEYKHISDLLELKDGIVCLPGGVRAEIGGEFLGLYPSTEMVSLKIQVPGETRVNELGMEIRTRVIPRERLTWPPSPGEEVQKSRELFFMVEPRAYVDYNKVGKKGTELWLRTRRPGDRFAPLGMGGKEKKLQDFFVSRKLPQLYRDFVPLVTQGDDIVFVGGQRVSEKFKVDENSKEILEIEVKPYLRQRRDRATICRSSPINNRVFRT